jgi:hypothetical protein
MEDKVCKNLAKKNIDHFYPFYIKRNGLKHEKVTLFTSPILFIHANEYERRMVAGMEGVISFVYWLTEPAVIPVKEIEGIRHFLGFFCDISVEKMPIYNIHPNNDHKQLAGLPAKDDDKRGFGKLDLPSLGYTLQGNPFNRTLNRSAAATVPFFKYWVGQDEYSEVVAS